MNQQSPSSSDIDPFEIHAPNFEPQINNPYSERESRSHEDSGAEHNSFMDLMLLLPNDKPVFPMKE